MINAAGLYTMPEEAYHADPCEVPSLSSSMAKILLTRSALHAWTAHPRLNPKYVHEEKTAFDKGSAAHALLLEGEDRMRVIAADSFRSKAAQEARDDARAAGLHPILEHDYHGILAMREVALAKIASCRDLSGITLADGKPEQTVIWEEEGAWCRARFDWLANDRKLILDYKTTAASANPDAWVRTMAGLGGEIQGSFYLRGNAATGGPPDTRFVFLVQELEPPHACAVIGLPPAFVELGNSKVREAISLWLQSMVSGQWPCYPDRICWVDPPPWHQSAWENRGAGHETHAIPYDIEKVWGHFKDLEEAA